MGYSFCGCCGTQGYWNEFCFRCCDAGDDGICASCHRSTNRATCDKCNRIFCAPHHQTTMKEHDCCGLTLCGRGDCQLEHVIYRLHHDDCGHEGCSFYDRGCRVCILQEEGEKETASMLRDRPLVESLLRKTKSKALNNFLSGWLAEVDSRAPSRANEWKRTMSTAETTYETPSRPSKRIKVD